MIRQRQTTASSSSTTVVTHRSVTRSSTFTESTSQIEIRRNQVQEDHNYGEPGPSTLRHSRRLIRQTPSTPEVDPLEIPEPQSKLHRLFASLFLLLFKKHLFIFE